MKQSDEWETPPEVFDYLDRVHGPFLVDVAATSENRKCENFHNAKGWCGLEKSWIFEKAWCNPPYSNPMPWIQKASEETKNGVTTCMLLPGDISTKWFRQGIRWNKRVIFYEWPRRIRFVKDGQLAGSPKFGSIVALFMPDPMNLSS